MSGQVNQVGSDQVMEDVDRSRIALTAYHYNTNTGFGEIDSWGVPTFVDVGNGVQSNNIQLSLESLLNRHPNSLPMLFTHSDSVSVNNLYHTFSMRLTDYVKVNHDLVKMYTVPYRRGLNHRQRITYYYMSTIYRQFFRGILDLIVQLHERDVSVFALSLDENFVIHDNVLKLFGLRHKFNSSIIDKKNDFVFLADALDELFINWTMPMDVADLCQCMRDYSKTDDDSFLVNHIALLQPQERIDRIRAFHEKNTLIPVNSHSDILTNMININWTTKFSGKKVNRGGWGHVMDCYYYKSNPSSPSIYHVTNVADLHDLNFQAIRFSRNMAAHIIQYMAYYRPKAKTKDIELTIMVAFAPQLLSFQKQAHRFGVLDLLLN